MPIRTAAAPSLAAPPLARGVYVGLFLDHPFVFAVNSAGEHLYGWPVPENFPLSKALGRIYERLEADDPRRMRLMA